MANQDYTNPRELINRIQSGDQDAFKEFIREYQRLVAHMVFRMVHNMSDREDLCQDIFLKAYRNLKGFRFQCKVSTWIAKIAYNTCLNYLQKKKPVLFEDHSPQSMSMDDINGSVQEPDSIAADKDVSLRIQTEMQHLPVPYRTILTLYHLDEMSYAEISDIMDLPAGTIKSYLFRARRQLKERLLKKYKVEELCQTTI
jgi:RNA polymerase sigma factor (sigma-70 family)